MQEVKAIRVSTFDFFLPMTWWRGLLIPMLTNCIRIATNLFPLWSVLVGILALVEPRCFLWFGKETIGVGLGVIMLGMGMTLKAEDFVRVWKEPKIIGLGVCSQFLIMPAWGALVAYLMKLPAEMAVGLILVASCPGGTASNVVVFLARGKVALSVSLTLASTIAAIWMTPLLTSWYAGHYLPVDPWALFRGILWVVLLPLSVGVVWNRFFPKSARQAAAYSPLVSVFFILLIVGFVLAAKKNIILENWVILTGSVLALHFGGFSLGYGMAALFGLTRDERRTLSIEVGMQNSGLGTSLASDHFAKTSMVAAPCALSAVMHCLIGSFLAVRWRNRSE
jgi:BASS family bile acid:Na+ symporter